LTIAQFCRLSAELADKPAAVRRTVELLAAGDVAAAADAAGGRFSDDWWAAEFFVKRLADHGATDAPRFTAADPVRRPRTASLFADD
jgi:hypothetical protein